MCIRDSSEGIFPQPAVCVYWYSGGLGQLTYPAEGGGVKGLVCPVWLGGHTEHIVHRVPKGLEGRGRGADIEGQASLHAQGSGLMEKYQGIPHGLYMGAHGFYPEGGQRLQILHRLRHQKMGVDMLPRGHAAHGGGCFHPKGDVGDEIAVLNIDMKILPALQALHGPLQIALVCRCDGW